MNSSEIPGLLAMANMTRPPEIFWFVPGSVTTVVINVTEPAKKEPLFNGTGYYIEDEGETGLNDLQTLFLACFATLVPLVISMFTAFGIRMLWRKYKRRRECKEYDGVLRSEESVESVSRPLHSHLLNTDKKCVDTHLTIDAEEVCDGPGVITAAANARVNNHSTTNGSIITMTLKNNHLIVETEERNDIEEDSRETKMKYSPSARDGVFVVEVQQGVRRSPGSGGTTICREVETSISVSDQCALIHNPPDRYSDDDTIEEGDENDYYVESTSPTTIETPNLSLLRVNTGLSQSNQSLSSNFTYTYGNQIEYENGAYGYPMYNGCSNEESHYRIENINKPKITSAIFKNRDYSKASIEILQDGPLLSDLMAGMKSSSRDDDDSIQEEQNRLGNCLPNGKEEEEPSFDSQDLSEKVSRINDCSLESKVAS